MHELRLGGRTTDQRGSGDGILAYASVAHAKHGLFRNKRNGKGKGKGKMRFTRTFTW
jgi:hypothetical protein